MAMGSDGVRSGSGTPATPALRPTFSRCLAATPESVRPLRRGVAEFAHRHGASTGLRDSVALAVSSAVTNAVRHAYPDGPAPGPVLVTATVDERTLLVTVSDEGCGLAVGSDDKADGRGLAVMTALADAFEIVPRTGANGGVVVRMRFALAG
jgi:anti-sigma regulatory factor (Ser/Thr protein kinase)